MSHKDYLEYEFTTPEGLRYEFVHRDYIGQEVMAFSRMHKATAAKPVNYSEVDCEPA